MAVVSCSAALHCLLNPLRRDAFLDDLVVDAVELVLLLAADRVVEDLLASLMPIGLCLHLELHIVHGRPRTLQRIRIFVFDTQFLKHGVRTASVVLAHLSRRSPDHG